MRTITIVALVAVAGCSHGTTPEQTGASARLTYGRMVVQPVDTGPTDPAKAYFEFEVDQQVRAAAFNAPPEYPQALIETHTEGRVLAQFVVDTMGRPEPATIKILETSNPLFSQSVREAIPKLRFVPATRRGRKARQVVQEPFTFSFR